MFSLLATLIAIVLVGLLAIATVYYGGSTFTDARMSADATALINQGQQVRAAVDMHKQQYRVGVDSLEELVDKKFLTALPASQWTSTGGYAVSQVGDSNLCLEANKKMGVNGIPNCEDPRISNLTVCCTTVQGEEVPE